MMLKLLVLIVNYDCASHAIGASHAISMQIEQEVSILQGVSLFSLL